MPEILLEMDAVVARAADPPQRDPGGGINGAGATVGTVTHRRRLLGVAFRAVAGFVAFLLFSATFWRGTPLCACTISSRGAAVTWISPASNPGNATLAK